VIVHTLAKEGIGPPGVDACKRQQLRKVVAHNERERVEWSSSTNTGTLSYAQLELGNGCGYCPVSVVPGVRSRM
jgi:hypothetical protein